MPKLEEKNGITKTYTKWYTKDLDFYKITVFWR